MKKLFILIMFLIPITLFCDIKIDFVPKENKNIIYLNKKCKYKYESNTENTIHKFIFSGENFLPKTLEINKGPVTSFSMNSTVLIVKTIVPVTTIQMNEDKIIISGYSPMPIKADFKNIKIKDIFTLVTSQKSWNWVKADEIPDQFISLSSEGLTVEEFLRLMDKAYGLKTVFINKNSIVLTKTPEKYENNLPEIVIKDTAKQNTIKNNKSDKKPDTIFDFYYSKYDITSLKKMFECEIQKFDDFYLFEYLKTDKQKVEEIVDFLNKVYYSSRVTELPTQTTKESTLKEVSKIYDIVLFRGDLNDFKKIYNVDIIKIKENKFFVYGEEKLVEQFKKIIEDINMETADKVIESNNSTTVQKTYEIIESKISITELGRIYSVDIIKLKENIYYIYGLTESINQMKEVAEKIKRYETPVEIKEEKQQKKKIYEIIRSETDLKNFDKIYNVESIRMKDNYYFIYGEEESVNEIKKITTNLSTELEKEKTKTIPESRRATITEVVKVFDIIKFDGDIMQFEKLFDVKIIKLKNNYNLVYGIRKSLETIKDICEKTEKIINIKTTAESTQTIKNETKKPEIIEKVIIIPAKIKEIIEKTLNRFGILFEVIENIDDRSICSLKYEKEKEQIVSDTLKNISNEILAEKISLKKLITYAAKINKVNVICDFLEDTELNAYIDGIDIGSIIDVAMSNNVFYSYINDNTILFYKNRKMIKYEVLVLDGQSYEQLKNQNIETIYNFTRLNILNTVFDKEKSFVISNPDIYAIDGKDAEVASILSIPVFSDTNRTRMISKVESGFKLKVKGTYDPVKNYIYTDIDMSISEVKDSSTNVVDSRSLKTSFKTKNGGLIKIGGLSFTKYYDSYKGLPIIKDIPVIGKYFCVSSTETKTYSLVLIIKAEVVK